MNDKLQKLEDIKKSISKSLNIDYMIEKTLKLINNIFKSDGVWLIYPIKINLNYFTFPYAYINPKYPQMYKEEKIIIDSFIRDEFQIKLDNIINIEPTIHTINEKYYENQNIIKKYKIKSYMTIILKPINDYPWILGIHQCSYIRNWNLIEQKLFKELAIQLADALDYLTIFQQLKQSESRLKRIIDNAADSIIFHDFKGKILKVNKQTCKNLGYSCNELKKMSIFDIEYSLSRFELESIWSRLKHIKTISIESKQIKKNKEIFNIESNMTYLNINNYNQIMIIIRDITKRKKAEYKKLKIEKQIYHSQKLESLGILAGGIAHDFNNLLTIIQGHNDIAILKLKESSPVQTNLKKIRTTIKKASYLTQQMLAYSGKKSFIIETININKLIIETTQLLKSLISKKAILKTNLAKDIGTFNGDSTQIRQILMNLIINASESLENQNGLITITTKEIDHKITNKNILSDNKNLLLGRYIYIEVSDSGCGMDKDTKSKIFDPFFTTKKNGHGLGMSAILGIVNSHKGTIHVHSNINQGTTIWIIFPKNDFEPLLKPDYTAPNSNFWKDSGNILISDDEIDVAEIMKDYLILLGYDITITLNGLEALNNYASNYNKYKYIFLDLNMPKLDGIQTFQKMKKINPDIKAFIMSGYNENELSIKYQNIGLCGFLQKPYTIEHLITLLKNVEDIT